MVTRLDNMEINAPIKTMMRDNSTYHRDVYGNDQANYVGGKIFVDMREILSISVKQSLIGILINNSLKP